jgi:hypothetical protein
VSAGERAKESSRQRTTKGRQESAAPPGTQEPSPRGRGNKTTVGWVGSQIGSTSAGKERVNLSNNESSTESDVRVTVRMWKGGPLREMAATKVGAFIPYAKTINGCHFAGRYVCDECQEPCGGISLSDVGKNGGNRHSRWLCDRCRTGKTRQPHQTRTPEQRQAVIDRLAAARRDRTSVRVQGIEDAEISKAVAAVTAEANPLKEVYGVM